MKKKYVVFCTLLICGFAAIAAQEVSRSFYVSSSEGDDDNDGMSVTRPMKTVQALYLKYRDADNMLRNCCINLKSNDIFYESVRYLDSCIVTSYGNGRKPLLCGFLKLTKKNRWKKVKNRPTVWRIDFSSENDFTGFHPSLSMNPEFAHDIGVIYDEKSNTIHGRMLQSLDSLKNEWDFFTSDKTPSNSESIYPHELFLCHRNPNKETQLNFSSYAIGIYNLTNCTVRNLAVKGFAHHGMAGLRNTTVEFCEVDVIGGAIQPNYPAWTRFGNGIECWIGNTANDNDTIRNCRISRTFDCGASIQGISVRMKNAKNIHFINNVFEHCRQAFEHFLVPQDNELSTYNDCEFSGNICLYMGDNGFDSSEPRDANILSYEHRRHPLKICNNIFWGANHYCGLHPDCWADITGNMVYIHKGQKLSYSLSAAFPTIYANTEADIHAYKKQTNDSSSIFLIDDLENYQTELQNIRLKAAALLTSTVQYE